MRKLPPKVLHGPPLERAARGQPTRSRVFRGVRRHDGALRVHYGSANLVVASNFERALQKNLMKRKTGSCQDCCRSRTTLSNHECEWHIRTCAQARDCRRTLQCCRLTVQFYTRDLARDIHSVNCELATAIPSLDRRGEGQTLEISGHRLPLAFGVESDGRDDGDKSSRQPRPALDDSPPGAPSENFSSLCGLSADGGHRTCYGDSGQEEHATDPTQVFEWFSHYRLLSPLKILWLLWDMLSPARHSGCSERATMWNRVRFPSTPGTGGTGLL